MHIYVETDRLIMREILPSDDQGMFELDSDPEVHRFLGGKPLTHIEECRKIIEFIRHQYMVNGIGRWAVIEKNTGVFIGWSGLKLITEPINNKIGFYDLGYRFIKRFWGKGYASETAKASIRYGFQQLGLQEIYGMAEVDHLASQQVLIKAGLRYLETFDWENSRMHWYKIVNSQ